MYLRRADTDSNRVLQSALPDDTDQPSVLLDDLSKDGNLAKESGRPKKRMRFNEDSIVIEAPSFISSDVVKAPVRRILNTQRPQASLALAKRRSTNAYTYAHLPPSSADLLASVAAHGIPEKFYREPHYSKAEDASERSWEFAGLTYHLKGGDGLNILDEWVGFAQVSQEDDDPFRSFLDDDGVSGWEYTLSPPASREIERWLAKNRSPTAPSNPPSARSQVCAVYSTDLLAC